MNLPMKQSALQMIKTIHLVVHTVGVIILLLPLQIMSAQEVSISTAIDIAEKFTNSTCLLDSITGMHRVTPVHISNISQPTMYTITTENGWVIVSADMRMPPILAYSLENISIDDSISAYQELLEFYENQVLFAKDSIPTTQIHPQWASFLLDSMITVPSPIISPLLYMNNDSISWGQSGRTDAGGYTYNKFCPSAYNKAHTDSCEHAVVGCVAVAMGQVMRYWKWPLSAVVQDDVGNNIYREYDWSLMPCRLTAVSNEDEINMVANLLHDIGVSVNMNYHCDGSGAFASTVPIKMRNMFGNECGNVIYSTNYDTIQWISMLKSELDSFRPIIYNGSNPNVSAHEFVIDGYDSENYFHVNFGWYGNNNGYYKLNNLRQYTSNHSAIMGIEPRVRRFELSADSSYLDCNAQTVRVTRQTTDCTLQWGHSSGIDMTINGDSATIESDGTAQPDRWVSAALYDTIMQRVVVSDTLHFSFPAPIASTGIEIVHQQMSLMSDFSYRKQYLLHFVASDGDSSNVFYWKNIDDINSFPPTPIYNYTSSCTIQTVANVISPDYLQRCPYQLIVPPHIDFGVQHDSDTISESIEKELIVGDRDLKKPDEIIYTYEDPTYALVTLPANDLYRGTISVIGFDGCCNSVSSSIIVNNSFVPIFDKGSETDTNSENKFVVYPNPANEYFQIIWNSNELPAGDIDILLYSQVGLQKYEKVSSADTTLQLDVCSLPSGIYLLNIMQGPNPLLQKLIEIKHN